MLYKTFVVSFVYLLSPMHLHRKRKVHQHSSVFDHHHQTHHLEHSINVEPKTSNKLIMNGGILTHRSEDNLGQEDEIDCLVDDDASADEQEFENEENDGTLLRESYDNNGKKVLYQHQYLNGNKEPNVKGRYREISYQQQYRYSDQQDTLLPNENSSTDIQDGTLQNNCDTTGRESKKLKNGDSSQIPRVQSILEKETTKVLYNMTEGN